MTATSTDIDHDPMVPTHRLPMVLAHVEVVRLELVSPTFVRVVLGGPALADFGVVRDGVDQPLFDQRIKLVFPNDAGQLPSFEGADESWLGTWLDIPTSERGHMRTYSVREVRGSGVNTQVVVDFVLHLAAGETGPGSAWAASAAVGDRVVLLAPRRGMPFGGIEFDPGAARSLLLVGDETALPAICGILDGLKVAGSLATSGEVFIEVPVTADVQEIACPDGITLHWLPRDGTDHGEKLISAVRAHFGLRAEVELVEDAAVDPDLWETPTYSSSGADLAAGLDGDGTEDVIVVGHDLDGLYAWIAGESRVVTTLRRCLVNELEVDRRQVAFMGYWRRGVAMRS